MKLNVGDDGSKVAIDSRIVFLLMMAVGAVYRASLAVNLRRLARRLIQLAASPKGTTQREAEMRIVPEDLTKAADALWSDGVPYEAQAWIKRNLSSNE
jgi:hypothetical protein